jgi:hypothetical protein
MVRDFYIIPETDWTSAMCSELLASSFSDGEPIIGPMGSEEDFLILSEGGSFYE